MINNNNDDNNTNNGINNNRNSEIILQTWIELLTQEQDSLPKCVCCVITLKVFFFDTF